MNINWNVRRLSYQTAKILSLCSIVRFKKNIFTEKYENNVVTGTQIEY